MTSITVNLTEHPHVYMTTSPRNLGDRDRGTLLRQAAKVLVDYGEEMVNRADFYEANAPAA